MSSILNLPQVRTLHFSSSILKLDIYLNWISIFLIIMSPFASLTWACDLPRQQPVTILITDNTSRYLVEPWVKAQLRSLRLYIEDLEELLATRMRLVREMNDWMTNQFLKNKMISSEDWVFWFVWALPSDYRRFKVTVAKTKESGVFRVIDITVATDKMTSYYMNRVRHLEVGETNSSPPEGIDPSRWSNGVYRAMRPIHNDVHVRIHQSLLTRLPALHLTEKDIFDLFDNRRSGEIYFRASRLMGGTRHMYYFESRTDGGTSLTVYFEKGNGVMTVTDVKYRQSR